jgi:hypothetical protein
MRSESEPSGLSVVGNGDLLFLVKRSILSMISKSRIEFRCQRNSSMSSPAINPKNEFLFARPALATLLSHLGKRIAETTLTSIDACYLSKT